MVIIIQACYGLYLPQMFSVLSELCSPCWLIYTCVCVCLFAFQYCISLLHSSFMLSVQCMIHDMIYATLVYVFFQASTLLLAIILRALVNQQVDNDIEGDNDARERTRQPLLDPCVSQTPGLAKGEGSAWHSDVWSSRMRVKVLILLHRIKHQLLIYISFYHSGLCGCLNRKGGVEVWNFPSQLHWACFLIYQFNPS